MYDDVLISYILLSLLSMFLGSIFVKEFSGRNTGLIRSEIDFKRTTVLHKPRNAVLTIVVILELSMSSMKVKRAWIYNIHRSIKFE